MKRRHLLSLLGQGALTTSLLPLVQGCGACRPETISAANPPQPSGAPAVKGGSTGAPNGHSPSYSSRFPLPNGPSIGSSEGASWTLWTFPSRQDAISISEQSST